MQDGVGVGVKSLSDLNRVFGINTLPKDSEMDYKGMFAGELIKSDSAVGGNKNKQKSMQSDNAQQVKQDKFTYYIVNYDGMKMQLSNSLEADLVDVVTDFNIGDYFEENRWEYAGKDTLNSEAETL